MARPLRIAVIAGEESGDLLGADLVRAIKQSTDRDIEIIGVGGAHLQSVGLNTMFDPAIIAIVGFSAVLRDLPRLTWLIGSTARKIAEAKPDCLVTIDSPAFNLRVARKVRRLDPTIPVIKYVCPSVWAWLPDRASKMRAFTDHVLCLLPFEPSELKRLGGPPGTFVGHRLTNEPGIAMAREQQASRPAGGDGTKHLLILPGSRRSEVQSLGAAFAQTANLLAERGHRLEITIPTVSRVEAVVKAAFAGVGPGCRIVTGDEEKWSAFGAADAALAASGTVSLELALVGVPLVSCYKTDMLMKLAYPFIVAWSASLPNLIVDRPVVPEVYDKLVIPNRLVRFVEDLWSDGPARTAQLQAFEMVRQAMKTDKPAGQLAADIVLERVRG